MKAFASVLLGVLAFACTIHPVHAQTTVIPYQGILALDGSPANGLFDMTFGLFTTDTGGTAVSTVTNTSVSVSKRWIGRGEGGRPAERGN